ncbi:MAG TPA: alpha/beta fold hydrolase [Acidimicrobiia bacterium]|nr:alpha/beta fold hydrolase [Acidimicrobiia bacterium]
MVVLEQLEDMVEAARTELCAMVGCVVEYRRPFRGGRRPAGAEAPDPAWRPAPVVLVHGAGHNPSAWIHLGDRLEAAGFHDLHGVAYGIAADVPRIAESIDARVEDARRRSGARRVHVVAHSLGGIATRYWHDHLGGRARAEAIVTLGSPHAGTPWARFGLTPRVRDLAPGSAFLTRLGGRAADYRHWTTVGASMDPLVPAGRAHLRTSRRVDLRALGHLGLLTSGAAGGWVCAALLEAEDRRHAAARAGLAA